MPGPSPLRLSLSSEARSSLETLVRAHTTPHALVLRARVVLLLDQGLGPSRVAVALTCAVRTVHTWRARWLRAPGIASLRDRPRAGRPPRIPLAVRCAVVKAACAVPDGVLPILRPRWTHASLAARVSCETGCSLRRSTVQRILSARGLRPHRVRLWLHSPDPQFREKVARICSLYRPPPEDAAVICIDEKPMQVLERIHPTRAARDGGLRYEYEYRRHGTRCLLAAFDIRTGRVIGQVVERRDGAALLAFVAQVLAAYAGRRVILVWDNLNVHCDGPTRRWSSFNARHGGRCTFVHTPKHASWCNQVEIWFSILQRRVLRYGSFDSAARLELEVRAFIAHWNAHEAHPFRWKFSGNFVPPRGAQAA